MRPGGWLWNRLQEVVRAVNIKIAPAVIDERFSLNPEREAIEFHGRWGTFRFRFLIADNQLGRGAASPDWLAYELEGLAGGAINNALRDLVRAEMQAEVGRVESAQDREWKKVEREYKELTDRVAYLETPWWRRAWLRLRAAA